MNKNLAPAWANLIVIGGPISVGKSTIVSNLGLPQVLELDEGDDLQALLLRLLYEQKRLANEVIELYFLFLRMQKYRDYSQSLTLHVLDRSILESLWFAENTLDAYSFANFYKLWEHDLKRLFLENGKPKLYVLLTCSWPSFEKRIFNRARPAEVENFYINRAYFEKHIAEYETYTLKLLKKFSIPYVVIPTDNLSAAEVEAKVRHELKTAKIL